MRVTVAASAPPELTAPSPPAPLGAVDPRSVSLQNSCVEILTPDVVCLELRPLGGDGHERGTFVNGVCAFIEDAPWSSHHRKTQRELGRLQPRKGSHQNLPTPAPRLSFQTPDDDTQMSVVP